MSAVRRNRGFVGLAGGGVCLLLLAASIVVWSRQARPLASSTALPGASPQAEQQAPDIRVTTLEGQSFSLADQQGQPVVLFFSASWCSSCVPEVQKLTKLEAAYRDQGLKVLFLSVDPTDKANDWERFRKDAQGPENYWALDAGQKATLDYGVRSTDTKVFIDRNGHIVSQFVGPVPYGVYESEVQRIL